MAKTTVNYVCSECATEHAKWAGRCGSCGAWNTLEEAVSAAAPRGVRVAALNPTSIVEITASDVVRRPTGSAECDRVLGGGLVPGSVLLLGGEPGIGKSTVLLQLCRDLAKQAGVLYVSGEESTEQIGLRARRLNVTEPNLRLVAATDTDRIIQTILAEQPAVVIIDSIQTVATDRFQSAPGSVTQVRESAARLQVVAKEHGISIIIVGHVTKDGAIAGPKVLEHLVDVVLYLEGERFHGHRLLRGAKNRFGPTDEVGVFTMDETGLHDMPNPAAAFSGNRGGAVPGTAVTMTLEGTRPLAVELQALTVETSFGYPKRTANGFDLNKLQLLIAVLSRHAGLKLASADVYFNVSNGYRLQDPGSDLAAALAVASAFRNQALPEQTVILGEVGLSGEIRPVQNLAKRLAEAKRAGLTRAIVPAPVMSKVPGMALTAVKTIAEAVSKLETAKQAAAHAA